MNIYICAGGYIFALCVLYTCAWVATCISRLCATDNPTHTQNHTNKYIR